MGFSLDKNGYIFKWYEEKTVNANGNSFILTNSIPAGGKLRLVDKLYGCEWSSVVHYSVNGKVVTFTESTFPETMDFQIWCFV